MRKLVLALVLGLVPLLSTLAQSVTLDVCNTGAIDVDVFVPQAGDVAGSHITPSTCAAVAKREGGIEQAFVGIAFADSRGEWGAARRFDNIPNMGVRQLLQATKLASALRGEQPAPPPKTLSAANQSASVRHGSATVTLPLQLLFQPSVPGCRTVPTGNSTTTTIGRQTEKTTEVMEICEDLHYTLMVEAHPDSREASLKRLPMGGSFEDYPPLTGRKKPLAEVDWSEIAADRKQHSAPEPVNLSDLGPSLSRVGERLKSGEPFTVPEYVAVRGTVSAVEIVSGSIDANTRLTVAEIYFRESPLAAGKAEFNACTARLDVLQEVFGADFRTSMVGKTIEVRARADNGLCRGKAGGMEFFLARQVRPVESAQFPAGTRVWVPPARYVAPPPPPPTSQQVEALIAESASNAHAETQRQAQGRLSKACVDQADKARVAAGNDSAKRAAGDQAYSACMQRVLPEAMQEGQKAAQCAREIVKANPGIRTDPFWAAVTACLQGGK